MNRFHVAIACIAFLSACSSPDKGFGKSETIERSELGSEWPLTVDSALLTCLQGHVTVTVAGQSDYIDAQGRPQDPSRQFTKIWSPDPSRPNGQMDLQHLVERGQSLCD